MLRHNEADGYQVEICRIFHYGVDYTFRFFFPHRIINNHGIKIIINHQFIEHICFSTSINFISCRFFCFHDSRIWMIKWAFETEKKISIALSAFFFFLNTHSLITFSSWCMQTCSGNKETQSKNATINNHFFSQSFIDMEKKCLRYFSLHTILCGNTCIQIQIPFVWLHCYHFIYSRRLKYSNFEYNNCLALYNRIQS